MSIIKSAVPAVLAALMLGSSIVVYATDLLDLNKATAAQLAESLNGIGMAKAEDIVAYRAEHGPFTTVDDLLLVRGIGEATLQKNRELVTVGK